MGIDDELGEIKQEIRKLIQEVRRLRKRLNKISPESQEEKLCFKFEDIYTTIELYRNEIMDKMPVDPILRWGLEEKYLDIIWGDRKSSLCLGLTRKGVELYKRLSE